MKAITASLLTKKGTIEGLLALYEAGQGKGDEKGNQTPGLSLTELSDEMGIADSTTRTRVQTFIDNGYVTDSAELRDNTPVRVFELTNDGKRVADMLDDLVRIDKSNQNTATADVTAETTTPDDAA